MAESFYDEDKQYKAVFLEGTETEREGNAENEVQTTEPVTVVTNEESASARISKEEQSQSNKRRFTSSNEQASMLPKPQLPPTRHDQSVNKCRQLFVSNRDEWLAKRMQLYSRDQEQPTGPKQLSTMHRSRRVTKQKEEDVGAEQPQHMNRDQWLAKQMQFHQIDQEQSTSTKQTSPMYRDEWLAKRKHLRPTHGHIGADQAKHLSRDEWLAKQAQLHPREREQPMDPEQQQSPMNRNEQRQLQSTDEEQSTPQHQFIVNVGLEEGNEQETEEEERNEREMELENAAPRAFDATNINADSFLGTAISATPVDEYAEEQRIINAVRQAIIDSERENIINELVIGSQMVVAHPVADSNTVIDNAGRYRNESVKWKCFIQISVVCLGIVVIFLVLFLLRPWATESVPVEMLPTTEPTGFPTEENTSLHPTSTDFIEGSLIPNMSITTTFPSFENGAELYSEVDSFLDYSTVQATGYRMSSWDVSRIEGFSELFSRDRNPLAVNFNGNISSWDVSNSTNMMKMFHGAINFDGDLSTWNVSKVESMEEMFREAAFFRGDGISNWDVSNVIYMGGMFRQTSTFNADISLWDTSSVIDMEDMFWSATAFNGDVSRWNVSQVRNMEWVFGATPFNGDLSNWDVSNVDDMIGMFEGATSFNGDLSNWDTSNVMDMWYTFKDATSFNGNISSWDVSAVESMYQMFNNASSFNQDISAWDVSRISVMTEMFYNAQSFNQDLCSWGTRIINRNAYVQGMFVGTSCPTQADPNLTAPVPGPFCHVCS